MWGNPGTLPWYYMPDKFITARLKPEHVTLELFGTHHTKSIIKTICSSLGHHSNVIIEFKNENT